MIRGRSDAAELGNRWPELMSMITLDRLKQILGGFPGLTVALVGDLFLDRYLEIPHGDQELSLETGLEAYQVTRVRNCPGALGTVMNNLAALGVGLLKPVTVIGSDGHGDDLMRSLKSLPVDMAHVVRHPERLTPTYTKPLLQQPDGTWRELNRLDVRTRAPLDCETRDAVCRHVEDAVRTSHGVIVLDQVSEEDEGVVHRQIRDALGAICRDQPDKLVYIDSRAMLARFSFGVLKGNEAEILGAADGAADVEGAVRRLTAKTGRPVVCTVGQRGMLVGRSSGEVTFVPGYPASGPVDIVGAGDSATSGTVLSLLAGADEVEAATIGNLVASITVQQLGTTGTASPDQVIARWHETQDER
jgi:bifunctional ADP-heptose synthase (sugar kinase/adenylyltransferase)